MADAIELATAYVSVVPTTKGLQGNLARQFTGAGTAAGGKAGAAFAGGVLASAKKVAGALGGVMLAGAGLVGVKKAIGAAGDLEQSVGGVQAVFKQYAGTIEKESKRAATSVGLSRNAYNELAATLGSTLKNKGIKGFANESKRLIGIGADLSSMFGGTTKEAVEALTSALRGETDPIERYGVSMQAASIEAEAMSMGLVKNVRDADKVKAAQNRAIIAQRNYTKAVKEHGKTSTEALSAEATLAGANSALSKAMEGKKVSLTDEQKAMAALSLITKQTADAQGNFARESDTFQGKQQRAAAQWDNLTAKIGGLFLPTATAAMGIISDQVIPGLSSFASIAEDRLGPAVAGVAAFVGNDLVPAVTTMAQWLASTGVPAVKDFAHWIAENETPIKVVAAIIGTLLLPVVISLGVQALLSGTRQAAGWALGRAAATRSAAVQLASHYRVVAGWVLSGAAALKSGAETVAIWTLLKIDSAKAAAAQVLAHVRMAAAWVVSKVQALASGAVIVGQWIAMQAAALASSAVTIASNVRAAASFALQRAAMLAGAVAMGVVRGAVIAWTAVQWLLNAALTANPIGLVVAGIALLVGGLILAYKRSETFRAVVQVAMRGVQIAFGWVWDKAKALFGWVKSNWPLIQAILTGPMRLALAGIKVVWSAVTSAFTSAKNWVTGAFRAAWSAVQAVIKDPIGSAKTAIAVLLGKTGLLRIFNDARAWVVGTFKSAWATAKTVITAPIDAARDAIAVILGAGKNGLQHVFRTAVNAVGSIWEGLKDKAKAPIRFVVETVLENGLLLAFRKVSAAVGFKAGENLHVSLPKGFHDGGYTGDLDPRKVAGVVHGDEQVIRSWARRKIESAHPGWLNFMNRTGSIPGYFAGGVVGGAGRFTDKFHQRLLAASRMAGETIHAFQRGFRPPTSYSGTSHKGDAIDLQVSRKLLVALRKVAIATWDRTGKGNWAPHMHGVPLPGAGTALGSAIWQAQDYLRGGDGLGGRDNGPRVGVVGKIGEWLKSGFSTVLGWFKNLIKVPLAKLNQVTGTPFGQMVAGLPNLVVEGMTKKLTGYAAGTFSASPGLHPVAERGAELVMGRQLKMFRGGESVASASDTAAILGGGKHLHIDGNVFQTDDLVQRIFDEWDRRERRDQIRSGVLVGAVS